MNLPEGHSLQNTKYHLTKVIGQGGFGITYLGVWNTEVKGKLGTVKTEVPVCIKEYFFKDYCYRDKDTSHVLVHSETGRQLFDKFKEKLIKEATILSDVHHPYIVNVLEVFEENNTAYIAMEHIAGCSLKYMLDVEGILPEKKVLRYISQIAQALDFVHQKNILHLDIKPSNILIDKKNNARLIDFGVSKRYDIEQQETSTTMLTLSKGFAPIEQYDNEGTQSFSPCPDIYSLGATMYNVLTGEIPTESILRVAKPLVNPSVINSDVTPQTEAAILTAMQVNPLHRYQSIKAMINELDIPSYFEDAANLLIEDTDYNVTKDDERTDFLPDSNASKPVDEEQTIVRSAEEQGRQTKKKKNKRRVLIPLIIILLTFLGGGIAYVFDLNGSQGATQIDDLLTSLTATSDAANETAEPVSSIENTGETPGNSRPVESTVSNTIDRTQPRTAPENQNPSPVETANTPSSEEIEEMRNELIESGKTKLSQNDYAEARADLEKANEIRSTVDVRRLLSEVDSAEEAANILARKALYTPKQTWGDFTIVEELSSGRWGAIDSKAIPIIECKYLRAVRSKNDDRAFEREDHDYDIYKSDGTVRILGSKDY